MDHGAEACQPFSGKAADEVFAEMSPVQREEFHRQYCLGQPRSSDYYSNLIREVLDLITTQRFENAGLKR